jgi:hypothetical protein
MAEAVILAVVWSIAFARFSPPGWARLER